jgi:hypothetical protein
MTRRRGSSHRCDTCIAGEAFMGCTSLTSAIIGNGVTSIEPYAFSNCTSLANVTIGSGNLSRYDSLCRF